MLSEDEYIFLLAVGELEDVADHYTLMYLTL